MSSYSRSQFEKVVAYMREPEPRPVVPALPTIATARDIATALRDVWEEATLSDGTIPLLLAQSALETGHWKQCWNWNLGNSKAGKGWTGEICQYPCGENFIVEKMSVEIKFRPPARACSFQSFRTLEDGARNYLTLLQKRFAPAWHAVVSGDATAFVRRIKAMNYFTGPIDDWTDSKGKRQLGYLSSVQSLQRRFLAELAKSKPSVEERDDAADSQDEWWREMRARVAVQQFDTAALLRDTPDDDDNV